MIAALAGFAIAALIVIAWKRLQAEPPTEFKSAPFVVLPDLSDTELAAQPYLSLRMYHAVACMVGHSGYFCAMAVTRPFATPEQAAAALELCDGLYPNARIVPVVLGFEPESEAAMDAFVRLVDEGAQ